MFYVFLKLSDVSFIIVSFDAPYLIKPCLLRINLKIHFCNFKMLASRKFLIKGYTRGGPMNDLYNESETHWHLKVQPITTGQLLFFSQLLILVVLIYAYLIFQNIRLTPPPFPSLIFDRALFLHKCMYIAPWTYVYIQRGHERNGVFATNLNFLISISFIWWCKILIFHTLIQQYS